MKFVEKKIDGMYVIELQPFTDKRGTFSRVYCENEFLILRFISNTFDI